MFVKIVSRRFSGRQPWRLAASAKIFKKASKRNLLKRRARTILQPLSAGMKKTVTIHFLAGADKASFSELAAEIKEQIKKHNF